MTAEVKAANMADTIQSLVLDGFGAKDKVSFAQPDWVAYVKEIADTPDEKLKTVLGVTGERVKRFVTRIDADHPDLELVLTEVGDVGAFLKSVCDLLKAAPENAEQTLLTQEGFGGVVRSLQQPRTRLLKSDKDRQKHRVVKTLVKNIGLKAVFTKGEDSFYGRPEHFKRFVHGSKYFQKEIDSLADRANLFQQNGMAELASTYQKRMREIEESIADTCGFYRLKPDEAAVTLARLHNFRWHDTGVITVASKFFEGNTFWTDGPTQHVEDPMAEALKQTLTLNTRFVPAGAASVAFVYQPRMYPLANFDIPVPEKVQKIIDNTEKFELLGGHAFFDYFWVLVPGISVMNPAVQKPNKETWTIRDGNKTVTLTDAAEAAAYLDKMLVQSGHLIPAIIGERDGKCFFLSMWK